MPKDSLLDEVRACIALIEAVEVEKETLHRQRVLQQSKIDAVAISLALIVIVQQFGTMTRLVRGEEQHSASVFLSCCSFFASLVSLGMCGTDLACNMLLTSDQPPLTTFALKSDADQTRVIELQKTLGLTPTSNLLYLKTLLKETESMIVSKLTFLSGQNKLNQGSALFGFFANGEGAAIDVIKGKIFSYVDHAFFDVFMKKRSYRR